MELLKNEVTQMIHQIMKLRALLCWVGLLAVAAPAQQHTNRAEPAGIPSSTNAPGKMHVLAPGDVVELKVYQEDDLNVPRGVIAADGTITHPLLGAVSIGGKTVEEASGMIHEMLAKDYLVNPKVSLTILDYSKWRFTISGHVARPNTYEVPGNESLNLIEAIALAGGYTRLGSPTRVTVQRIVSGEKRTFRNLDAEAMAKDKNTKPFLILPGDMIEVGEKIF